MPSTRLTRPTCGARRSPSAGTPRPSGTCAAAGSYRGRWSAWTGRCMPCWRWPRAAACRLHPRPAGRVAVRHRGRRAPGAGLVHPGPAVDAAVAGVRGGVLGRHRAGAGLYTARGARAASVVLLFVVVVVHWCGRQLLYQRASRADAALAAADQDARDQFVILSRTVERREHDRLLHDTVLNTLTAVARSGPAGGVVGRCEQDLARLERALSEPADPAGAFKRRVADLVADLHAVAGEMRARGLTVQSGAAAPPGQCGRPSAGGPSRAGPGGGGHHARHPGGAGQRGRARGNRRGMGHRPPAGRGTWR